MLLSRFWYVVLGIAVGVLSLTLLLAQNMFNRSSARAVGEGLSSDGQFVTWYLKDDARARSAHLIKFALEPAIAKSLHEASQSETELKSSLRDKVSQALREVNKEIPPEQAFDAVFAIDQHGRVVAHLGYEQASGMADFELGGYPAVADALHGYVRDDTLVWDRLYRVVARPVEYEVGNLPAGAIVGARIIDDQFARDITDRTGAAVAFYVGGQRVAGWTPEGFDKANLDTIVSDLGGLEQDEDYATKGLSKVREIGRRISVQYRRLPGESYELGAGYAVARMPFHMATPWSFLMQADDKDKEQAGWLVPALLALLAVAVGLGLSFIEHTRPLSVFKHEARAFAAGKLDQLQPSKFRGVYRQVASDINDGVDKVAAAGGNSRRAADLEQVLGELPAQPQMSAFSVPSGDGPVSSPVVSAPVSSGGAMPAPPARGLPRPPGRGGAAAAVSPDSSPDPELEWRQVFEQFVATKQQCGEPTEGLTYDKFRGTLLKNREALVTRHGAVDVRFSVYVKEGKAALKASPVRS